MDLELIDGTLSNPRAFVIDLKAVENLIKIFYGSSQIEFILQNNKSNIILI